MVVLADGLNVLGSELSNWITPDDANESKFEAPDICV